jgi:hypothetical protein
MKNSSDVKILKHAIAALILIIAMSGGQAMAIEEPPFKLELRDGGFEVRDYPSRVVAEVAVSGGQKEAANAGFRLLAGYIFGQNKQRLSISMTAPVAQWQIHNSRPSWPDTGDESWIVQFTMPRAQALETLPEPNDNRVRLRVAPAARVAVIRFSGLANPRAVEAETSALNNFVAVRHWRAIGPTSLAQYDPPWTPWFMRRNEIIVPIASK